MPSILDDIATAIEIAERILHQRRSA